MKRTEFSFLLAKFLVIAKARGYNVILDSVHRSDKEQNRLFLLGKSKCDGFKIKSKHQSGKAADIYGVYGGRISEDISLYRKLHDLWEEFGGGPVVGWTREDGKKIIDWGHFE